MPILKPVRKNITVPKNQSSFYKWLFKNTVHVRKQISAWVLKAKLFWDATHPNNKIDYELERAFVVPSNITTKPSAMSSLELSKTYTSYSGVDTKLYINDKAFGNAQAIVWTETAEGNVSGSLISLLLDQPLPVNLGETLKLTATNEYGKFAVILNLEQVNWISQSSGVSIDDIVIETTHTFIGKMRKEITNENT